MSGQVSMTTWRTGAATDHAPLSQVDDHQHRRRSTMRPDLAEQCVVDFERGLLSRRQLVSRLMGLGALTAACPHAAQAGEAEGSTFRATGLDHVALTVRDVR